MDSAMAKELSSREIRKISMARQLSNIRREMALNDEIEANLKRKDETSDKPAQLNCSDEAEVAMTRQRRRAETAIHDEITANEHSEETRDGLRDRLAGVGWFVELARKLHSREHELPISMLGEFWIYVKGTMDFHTKLTIIITCLTFLCTVIEPSAVGKSAMGYLSIVLGCIIGVMLVFSLLNCSLASIAELLLWGVHMLLSIFAFKKKELHLPVSFPVVVCFFSVVILIFRLESVGFRRRV